jgi:hypothetical protein
MLVNLVTFVIGQKKQIVPKAIGAPPQASAAQLCGCKDRRPISHSEKRQNGKSGETAKEIGGQRHISHIDVILSPIDKD